MNYRLMSIALLALVAALIVAGCSTTTKTGNGSDSRLLLKNSYEKFQLQLDAKTAFHANVATTDGIPVDLLFLDAAAFDTYTGAVNGSGASWSTLASKLGTTSAALDFTTVAGGTYYLVVDNTDKVPGGADGTRDVMVNVNWTY